MRQARKKRNRCSDKIVNPIILPVSRIVNIENCGAYNPAKETTVSCPRAAKNQKQSGGIIRGAATYILKSGKPQSNGRRAE